MSEEIKKNTVATVGMRFSIIGLVLLITGFWLPLLLIGLILWIIGLFHKPRWKARVAVIIPLVVFIALASVVCYVWSSVKTPAKEFMEWTEIKSEQLNQKGFDNDRFNNITNEEINNIRSSISEEEFKVLMENSTWSNVLEKWAYVVFWLIQQVIENSLEKYNDGYVPEINDEDSEVLDIDINVENNEEENTTEGSEEVTGSEEENVEIITDTKQSDIDQILDILE